MDHARPSALDITPEVQHNTPVVCQERMRNLDDLCRQLTITFATDPLTASAIEALVMQAHLRQLLDTSETYFDSFGLLQRNGHQVILTPSQSLQNNLREISDVTAV